MITGCFMDTLGSMSTVFETEVDELLGLLGVLLDHQHAVFGPWRKGDNPNQSHWGLRNVPECGNHFKVGSNPWQAPAARAAVAWPSKNVKKSPALELCQKADCMCLPWPSCEECMHEVNEASSYGWIFQSIQQDDRVQAIWKLVSSRRECHNSRWC